MSLVAGSMFAGIGGFDLGAQRAGMKVRWAVEKDEKARELLRARFPETEVLENVTKIDPGGLRRVDVLTAGWPCQDVSVAGNRAGLAGERSGLWREVVRWLAILRPTWFVGENVPGLLSSAGGRDMGTVLGQLGELGYGWAYRVLDARYFGVAQRRRRVLIVGCLGDPARAAEVLLEPEGREWHPASRREAGQEIAGTLGGGSGERGWAPDTDRMTFVPEAVSAYGESGPGWWHDGVGPIRAEGENRPSRPSSLLVAPTLRSASDSPAAHGKVNGTDRAALVVSRPLTAHPSGSRLDGESDQFVVAHPLTSEGADASEDGTGRGTPLVAAVLAPTLRGFGHGWQGKHNDDAARMQMVRRLTPLECERLQGFPDGWTAGFSDSTRYGMLGNAICVNVAEWVLKRIARTEP